MLVSSRDTCPLPEHPALAEVANALNRAGAWGHVYDREYRLVYMTEEIRRTNGGLVEMATVPVGAYCFGSEYIETALSWRGSAWTLDSVRMMFSALGSWALADAPGGHEEMRELVDPRLREMVDGLSPANDATALTYVMPSLSTGVKESFDVTQLAVRICDREGHFVGI